MTDMKKVFVFAAAALSTLAAMCSCSGNGSGQPTGESVLVGEHRGSDDFKIGVAGYTFRKFSLDETLATLQEMGVRYLSVKDFWLPIDATVEEMDAFKAKCAGYGVEPYILGPIYMHSREDIDAAFAYVARFGHKTFIGVPDYELLNYTISKVRESGIRVAIHTHGPDKMPFPNITDIVERVGDPAIGIGCCMDLGHSIRYGDDLLKDIAEYKDWIYDIHIKDESAASDAGRTWEMGRGVMDFVPIIKALRAISYQGNISVEFEKNAEHPSLGTAESIGYLRAVCDIVR